MNNPVRKDFSTSTRELNVSLNARAHRSENKLDEMLHRMDASDIACQTQFQRTNENFDSLNKGMHDLRLSISSLKRTVVTTVLVTWIPLGAFIYISNSRLLSAIKSENKAALAVLDASRKLDLVSARLVALPNQRAPTKSTTGGARDPISTPVER